MRGLKLWLIGSITVVHNLLSEANAKFMRISLQVILEVVIFDSNH